MKQEQRQHPRTPIKLMVQATLEDGQQIKVDTWDISDGGIGIHINNHVDLHWEIGMEVKAKVLGLPIEGPELPMRVVRITDDRIGMQLIGL